jgi:hypothetical protein
MIAFRACKWRVHSPFDILSRDVSLIFINAAQAVCKNLKRNFLVKPMQCSKKISECHSVHFWASLSLQGGMTLGI